MNLFNVTQDCLDKLGGKPRTATDDECKAYLKWQRERRGLPDLEMRGLEWSGFRTRGQDSRICIAASFGKVTQQGGWVSSGRWEGDVHIPGEHRETEYENGAYSLLMPGYNARRATVTMETLNDAGEVVATSTMPIEPKKGGIVWTREAVRAAAGPMPKAPKSKRTKSGAAIPSVEVPASLALSGAESDSAPHPVQDSGNRSDALRGLPSAPKRTPAHERAVRRAWAERKARRDWTATNRRLKSQLAGVVAMHRSACEERDEARLCQTLNFEAMERMRAERDKRRRSTLLARQRGQEMVKLAAVVRHLASDLETARRSATYMDADGREGADHVSRVAHHAMTAIDRAEQYERELAEARAAIARQQDAIDRLGDAMVAENARALRAERALAAVTARKNGWPPAVRPTTVAVAFGTPIAA